MYVFIPSITYINYISLQFVSWLEVNKSFVTHSVLPLFCFYITKSQFFFTIWFLLKPRAHISKHLKLTKDVSGLHWLIVKLATKKKLMMHYDTKFNYSLPKTCQCCRPSLTLKTTTKRSQTRLLNLMIGMGVLQIIRHPSMTAPQNA